MQCQGVGIHRIKMRGDQKMINQDGIDLDMCRDVTVSDSFFKTSDDCIVVRSMRHLYDTELSCENITVSNCTMSSRSAGIRVGYGRNPIRNCVFQNLVIRNSNRDVGGRTLMPGLIDAHIHAFASDVAVQRIEAFGETYRTAHAVRMLGHALSCGFTTVRDIGGGNYSLYLRATQDALAGPAASGSYYVVELQNPVFTNGICSATLAAYKRQNGVVTALTSFALGCRGLPSATDSH